MRATEWARPCGLQPGAVLLILLPRPAMGREVLEIIRRLMISAVLLAIDSEDGMMRLAIALIVCFLHLILLFTVRPFKRIDDTIVAASSNVILVFTFLAAIFVKIFDDIAATPIPRDEAASRMRAARPSSSRAKCSASTPPSRSRSF